MRGRFEGVYYKQWAGEHALALIPGRGEEEAFLQVLTKKASYQLSYPLSQYKREGDTIRLGESRFSPQGISLRAQGEGVGLWGELTYHRPTPLKGDIMGPFRFLPMECRHGVTSLRHDVMGQVTLNGQGLDFTGGLGYTEWDRGRSFPSHYCWVHVGDFEAPACVMASVAKIPFWGGQFWGCIAVVWLKGCAYRLATYRGAKILHCGGGVIDLAQGSLRLTIRVEGEGGEPLRAPKLGRMEKTVTESLSTPAEISLTHGGQAIFKAKSRGASYEDAMGGLVLHA